MVRSFHTLILASLCALALGSFGCSSESNGPSDDSAEEDELTAKRTIYFADLGPAGIEFFTKKGRTISKLSFPGTLTGDEDEPKSGSVRVGGSGCDACLFFQHPKTKKFINVAKPTNKSLKLEKQDYSYTADGYLITNGMVKFTVAADDPEYGTLEVAWP